MTGPGTLDSHAALALDAQSEGCVVMVSSGEIVACNPAAERILGLTRDQLMGRTSRDPRWSSVHEDGSPFPGESHPAMVTLTTGQPLHDVVMGVKTPDGALRWISINSVPVPGPGGSPSAVVTTFRDITRWKAAEASLRETQESLRLAVEAGGVGLWDWDLATDRVTYSTEWKRQLGHAEDEISDSFEEWASRVHPDDLEPTVAGFRSFLADPRARYEAEHRLRHRDGSYRWILARADVVRDAAGRPVRMIGSHVDITDLKLTEARLRKKAELLALAQHGARAGTWHWDAARGAFDWSPELFRLLGLDPGRDAASLESWTAVLHPDDRERVLAVFSASVGRRELFRAEYRIVRPGGAVAWIEGLGTSEYDDAGRHVRMAGLCIDVTDLKRAKEAERQAVEALRKAEERWKFALEGAGDGVWDGNPTTSEQFFSRRYVEMLGYEEGELRPEGGEWSSRIHPDDRERVFAAIERHLADPREPYEAQHRLLCKDGTYRWFLARGLLVERDAAGRPWRMIGTIRDTTAERQAEESLQRSRDELAAANVELVRASRLKDEFVASLSHELRTPLGAILGMAAAIQEQPAVDVVHRANVIETSAHHLLGLINDVIDVARIDAGKVEPDLAPVSGSEVGQTVVQRFREPAAARKLRLSLSVEPPGLVLDTDARLLVQLLRCLVDNAVKFTGPGGAIGLEMRGDQAAGLVRATVWDTGIGIVGEHLDRLFESFVQLDGRKERSYGGLGLGLALSQRLARLLGASLQVTSEPGAGSRFTVVLPWASRRQLRPAPGAAPHPSGRGPDEGEGRGPLCARVPDSLRRALVVAVERADAEEIAAAVRRLVEADPEAGRIVQQMVDRFDYEELLRLCAAEGTG